MAWDPTRPVPWKRFAKEWVVIGLVVAAISWFVTDNRNPSSYVGIVLAGGVYVLFGAVLAKFGYVRKTLAETRAASAAAAAARAQPAASSGARAKPAPTKRTAAPPAHRSNKKKR